MRLKVLMLIKGGEFCSEEISNAVGCGASAASAYARDNRKGKYGGHNIISRQGVYRGRRTTYYRWEKR
jgi:hypothetical protein